LLATVVVTSYPDIQRTTLAEQTVGYINKSDIKNILTQHPARPAPYCNVFRRTH